MIGWRSLSLDAALLAMILASVAYLRRVTMPRPPIGRFTAGDVTVMSVMLVLLPAAYVRLPAVAVASVFGVVFFTAGQTMLAPLIGGWFAALASLALVGAEVAAKLAGQDAVMLAVNDVFVVAAVIGVVNLWAQTGMRAAHVAGLAAVLTGYDLVATWFSPLTGQFLAKMATAPFLPLLAVVGGRHPGGLGLGDCLVLAMWPTVLLRTYGKRAAAAGAALGLLVTVLIEFAFRDHWIGAYRIVPTMAILGPLIIIHYLALRRWRGRERRTWQWRAGTWPAGARAGGVSPLVTAALEVRAGPEAAAGTYLAVAGGQIVAGGATPGAARRAARHSGNGAVPVVLHSSVLSPSARPEQPGGEPLA